MKLEVVDSRLCSRDISDVMDQFHDSYGQPPCRGLEDNRLETDTVHLFITYGLKILDAWPSRGRSSCVGFSFHSSYN